MKPQPLSDPERNGRVSDLYDELAKAGEIGHHETLWHIVRLEVERAIAARDAQWAAMIGEPVAWLLRPKVQRHPGKTIIRGAYTVEPSAEQMEIAEADNDEYLPLYAIKETP